MESYAYRPPPAVEKDNYYYPPEKSAYDVVDSRQKNAILQRLVAINQEFCTNRQGIYEDKIKEINLSVKEICDGTHPTYLDKVKVLRSIRDAALTKAELLCNYQLGGAYKLYKDEIVRLEEEYNAEKEELRERLRNSIEDRLKRLKEDRDILDINQDFPGDAGPRSNSKRNLRKRGPEPTDQKTSKKKRQVSVTLSYAVTEEDAQEDLSLMKKMGLVHFR
ncbi:Sds3-like-domain-containing protein [Dimargaris cristalligena]|uniref:Sds3-like-domain-containing protein n=1 Tax=Dimargaris cristalligena TaxID=215637 RepID=A0A4V1J5P3_9FUNG|nr:Sds3-like-domain-containing protein [Dimargaris cristalligena]|eukprot:RKP39759.1 Sds3-like-domain-containing protein [Dimargaris cristalligena]